jgi:hypothetical protein
MPVTVDASPSEESVIVRYNEKENTTQVFRLEAEGI